MTPLITPTAGGQRIELLDALRGFAIFGILMVNMQLFHQPITSMLIGYSGSETTLDLVSVLFTKFFFEGKFYVLFSMLFGYGFWIFINRTTNAGKSIIPTFRLRIFFLLLFGILHVVMLWAGDILVFYALLGFVLILFRKKSDRGLVKWAVWLALIPSIVMLIGWGFYLIASMQPESKDAFEAAMQGNASQMKQLAEESAIAYSNGKFSEIVNARLKEYSNLFFGGIVVFYPVVLAMFLFGVWAARKGIIANYQNHLPFFRKALVWGLALGVVANSLYTYAYIQVPIGEFGLWGFLGTSMHTLGGFMLCLVYVSGIVLMTSKGKLKKLRSLMAPVGRMALTNYLLHSIICTTLFLPYGFGLFGKFTAWQGILLTIVIFLLQIPFSRFWLNRFNYGPFEWLWRSLTYWKVQPFVRKD
jgi:uncharacterized protein